MIAADFHISSNYLSSPAAAFNAHNTDPIVIELYNYEVENDAAVAAMDIQYTITLTNAAEPPVVKNGTNTVSADPETGRYTLALGTGTDKKTTHTITVTPDGSGDVTVTVKAVAPYEKTLSASFTGLRSLPRYTLVQDGAAMKLTIYTYSYSGQIKVNAGIAPDNTNDLMADWTTGGDSNTLTVNENETYELLFFGSASPQATEKDITIPDGQTVPTVAVG